MKHTKKLLSVLLALAMLFSCAALASAEPDGYNWVEIPTSPDGLQTGDAYLEFTPEFVESNMDMIYDAEDVIREMNRSTWYIDVEKRLLKGSFSIEPEMEEGNYMGDNCDPQYDVERSVLYYNEAVREVGVEWEPVNLTNDLHDGDWYMELDELKENLIAAIVKHEGLSEEDARDKVEGEINDLGESSPITELYPYGVDVYIGKTVRKIRMGVQRIVPATGDPYIVQMMMNPYSDNPEEGMYYDATDASVKRYHAPVQPDQPPETPDKKQSFVDRALARLKDFFARIRDFFFRIFRR